MANAHASQTFAGSVQVRGVLHLLFGRGRVGKSTQGRWMAGRAAEQGRHLVVVDADQNNASLASFLPDALRPERADDTTMTSFLENQTEQLTRACRQLSQMVAAARWMPARKLRAVLS